MKTLTTPEKMNLLRHHGECLSRAFQGIGTNSRDDLIEHAQRAIELVKSIPKIEFSVER